MPGMAGHNIIYSPFAREFSLFVPDLRLFRAGLRVRLRLGVT